VVSVLAARFSGGILLNLIPFIQPTSSSVLEYAEVDLVSGLAARHSVGIA
jgi:hypothetical protein